MTYLFPGLADPVFDAQRVFRAVLDALAHPGRIVAVGDGLQPPPPLGAAAAAILLTLADADTNVWLDDAAGTPELAAHLGFHCGCPRVSQPGEARFAVIADPAAMPPLSAFDQGTASYPDRSATLIIEVAALEGGRPWTLAGPGIKDRAVFAPQGLPQSFPGWLTDNRARFPMGVDLLFTCADRLAALARTTRLED